MNDHLLFEHKYWAEKQLSLLTSPKANNWPHCRFSNMFCIIFFVFFCKKPEKIDLEILTKYLNALSHPRLFQWLHLHTFSASWIKISRNWCRWGAWQWQILIFLLISLLHCWLRSASTANPFYWSVWLWSVVWCWQRIDILRCWWDLRDLRCRLQQITI